MRYGVIEIERAGGVATIWMNRPQMHNAFNAQLIEELNMALTEMEREADTRVVILAGRGRSFSAGADLAWMRAARASSFEDNFDDALRLAETLRLLAEFPKPTIARVHGPALGGGMGLAAACDICVASNHASFAASETRFGLIPSVISPYILRAIGSRQALRYFLTAERISAARAHEIGLAHEYVDGEHLDKTLDEVAQALVKGGPKAMAGARKLIRDLDGRPIDEALIRETARRIALARSSDEAAEGIAAFFEKRLPHWRG
jgi:methylglutaconyl-CoA hydratase